jgi:hypothetical protein
MQEEVIRNARLAAGHTMKRSKVKHMNISSSVVPWEAYSSPAGPCRHLPVAQDKRE